MASNDFLLASWETFAPSWDEGMGDEGMGDEGNEYFRFLELPILEKLIGRLEGCHAIDLATGNGLVARWLAQKAASVMATDGAATMIDRAKARTDTSLYENKISFHRLDVTNQSSWDNFMAIDNRLMVSSQFDLQSVFLALTCFTPLD
jgi:2-polyprenyl-3-methyl-5-hydroxy-6-metoxy-1,4-benzoquinol methylase